jgi:putative membrane protein
MSATVIPIFVFVMALLVPFRLALAGESEQGTSPKVSRAEANFLKEAAEGGLMEVELGKLATEKAASSQVKDFGKRMQQDHGKAAKELEQIAAKKGVDLPKQLEGKHKSTVEKLSKLSGEKFDREYMETMINDHKEDVEKFQRETEKGKDPDIKTFAGKQLPTLKKHLELARATGQQVGAVK